MEEQAIELPPMPQGAAHNWSGEWPEFSKEDMERFGRACVLAERERCAQVCEALIDGRSKDDLITEDPNDAVTWGEIYMAEQCAAAIREG